MLSCARQPFVRSTCRGCSSQGSQLRSWPGDKTKKQGRDEAKRGIEAALQQFETDPFEARAPSPGVGAFQAVETGTRGSLVSSVVPGSGF